MLNNLTKRLDNLEANRLGRGCDCPPPEPEPQRPGFREVSRQEVHLGLQPCPACGGLRDLVIDQVIIALGDDIELT